MTNNDSKIIIATVSDNRCSKFGMIEIHIKRSKYLKHAGKTQTSVTKGYADCPVGYTINIGDKVSVVHTKPLSKKKRYRVVTSGGNNA